MVRQYHQRQLVDGFKSFYNTAASTRLSNTTNGSWWIVQVLFYNTAPPLVSRIPPTAVGGWFKSFLRTQTRYEISEYHQRQLVDCSSPF
jgi:hypothetical protein